MYPNPLSSFGTLTLTQPAAEVRIAVYDVLGRLVLVPYQGELEAGRHNLAFDSSAPPSGICIVYFESGRQRVARKVTVVR